MNIAIDIGNTHVKVGVFAQAALQEVLVLSNPDAATWQSIANIHLPQNVIVSSVAQSVAELQGYFSKANFVTFSHKTPVPLQNNYKKPQSLGLDRLAAAIGAAGIYPKQSVMVIDAGSCITMDMVKKGKEYSGGVIAPGLQMRFNALHTFTEKLPLCYPDQQASMIIGEDTTSAIITGVQQGLLEEVKGTIARYQTQFGTFSIVLCGGDASFLEHFLKNSIFASQITHHPHLVLMGLQRILAYQQHVH